VTPRADACKRHAKLATGCGPVVAAWRADTHARVVEVPAELCADNDCFAPRLDLATRCHHLHTVIMQQGLARQLARRRHCCDELENQDTLFPAAEARCDWKSLFYSDFLAHSLMIRFVCNSISEFTTEFMFFCQFLA
jgi:hypothetical protein